MSELTKELEQDKAFIEEVADRIYSDTDDIEESMPDPEWIDRMADIADKYITRFETSYNFANNLADELLTSNIQLNDDQKIVLEWLKEKYTYTDIGAIELFWRLKVNSTKEKYRYRDVYMSYKNMMNSEQLQILAAFAQWGLEQEGK